MPNLTPTEHVEQCTLHQWLTMNQIPHFAVPNGAFLGDKRQARMSRLKAEGLQPGAPDIVLIPRGGPARATGRGCCECGEPLDCCKCLMSESRCGQPIVVEMKRQKGGTLSAAQKAIHATMRDHNWTVVVAKGAADAIRQLQTMGFGR